MHRMKSWTGALILAAGLALAPSLAQAQTPAQAPARAPATAAAADFDSYRVLAITAGVIGGAVVGAAVANVIVAPSYAYIVGASVDKSAMYVMSNGMLGFGYSALASGVGTLGAVAGGFYADYMYQKQ